MNSDEWETIYIRNRERGKTKKCLMIQLGFSLCARGRETLDTFPSYCMITGRITLASRITPTLSSFYYRRAADDGMRHEISGAAGKNAGEKETEHTPSIMRSGVTSRHDIVPARAVSLVSFFLS